MEGNFQTIERINLSRLQKCHQNWHKMKPTNGGRMCAECQKTIVDFREKTPHQIAESHANAAQPVCGLYASQHLEKSVFRKTKNRFWPLFSLSLVGIFSSNLAEAQVQNSSPAMVQQEESASKETKQKEETFSNKTPKDSALATISGYVTDSNSGEALPFVSVFIKNTKIGVTTDFDGFYQIHIPKSFDSATSIVVVYSFIGYGKKEVQISKQEWVAKNEFLMNMSFSDHELEAIAFGVTIKEPFHQRAWRKVKALFQSK